MKEVNRAICLELEQLLSNDTDKNFVEALYDLGVIDVNLRPDEDSEETWQRVKGNIEDPIPRTEKECLDIIYKICKEAVRTYDNEEFYEDDCDKFMGESIMAQRILDLLYKLDAYKKMVEDDKTGRP